MTTWKNFLFSLLIAVSLFGTLTVAALAQDEPTDSAKLDLSGKLDTVGDNAGFNTDEDGEGLPELIGRVIQVFLSILGMVFMGYIIYAGSLWLTARGEEEKITKAKGIIRGSIIGLIVIFAAYAITYFVTYNLITETGFGQGA